MVGLGVLELVAVHGAGAAVRRNPTSKVRETPVRQWALEWL